MKICGHVFDLLGSGEVDLGPEIPWHKDYKSGKVWSWWLPQRLIRYKFNKGFDVKVPWELSRFYHLPVLAQAYCSTSDEKYFTEIECQVSDWIKKNPVGFGVNWKCTMEVAIRACNWVLTWQMIDSISAAKTSKLKDLFLKSLRQHGRFIYSHLELGHTNHYLSDLVGLIYLGVFFPEFEESAKWLKKGTKELEEEMKKQINPDGCDFESSVPYHRLVVELFGYSALLCKLNNIKLSDYFWNKLKEIFDFVAYYTKPNGLAPQIGDNDNGQLHKLSTFNRWLPLNDHRYLFDLARQIWPDYQPPKSASRNFPQSGYYIMRDKDNYMFISAGEVGIAGHKHNDILSFELQVCKQDFIVDPGTYVYTPDAGMRNLFRSTAYHNTVVIDSKEQNRFDKRSLFIFMMRDDSKVRCLRWKSNNEQDLFVGEHDGYKRLKEPISHKRTIKFSKGKVQWEIKDEFYCTNSGQNLSHTFNWHFHLAPQIAVEKIGENELLLKGKNNTVSFKIHDLPVAYSLVTKDSWFSPQYGEKIRSKVLRLECKCRTPFQINFEMRRLP